ncbi:hypothetical protein MJO29_001591, partial [Puccinia striiformis f. sp. tritici]
KLLEMQNYNALILVMITPNSFTILLLKRTWEGGNPTHCASPELPGVQIIDFDKYQKMMKIMDEIECFQVKFNFLEVSSITAYIRRIGCLIGLDCWAAELWGFNGIWKISNSTQLDAPTQTLAGTKSPSFPSSEPPRQTQAQFYNRQTSNGSPSQYDIVSAAQIESLAKLAEIWASANPFLSVADGRSRNISSNQLIELGEHHNKVHSGLHYLALIYVPSDFIRLLSESLCITLVFAFTNGLYAIAAVSRLSPKLNKTLAMERVNGSSTALIQAHRDSVREGYNLAFSPDLVTNGLVSAAITVLQLASEGKQPGKQVTNPSSKWLNFQSRSAWTQRVGPLHVSRASSLGSNSHRHSKTTSPC